MENKLGIICAMEEELAPLILKLKRSHTTKKANMVFYSGEIDTTTTVLVVSGIGKVNAAICTQILIDDFKVSHLINSGVAGGVKKEINPLDVVIGTSLVQHDMDATAFGSALGEIPRLDKTYFECDPYLIDLAYNSSLKNNSYKTYKGIIVTGDQFINDKEKVRALYKNFSALACEMEGAAIGQTAFLNNIPFLVIRAISDNANSGASMDFNKFKNKAVVNSLKIIEDIISSFNII